MNSILSAAALEQYENSFYSILAVDGKKDEHLIYSQSTNYLMV